MMAMEYWLCGTPWSAAFFAHVAAYHGNVGALRVLRARGVTINAENSRGERPVHKAQLRRHDAAVATPRRPRTNRPLANGLVASGRP